MTNNLSACPACGSSLSYKAWDGALASFEICKFCGIQFGYTDAAGGDAKKREAIYKNWKAKWLEQNQRALSNEEGLEVIARSLR